MKNKKNKNKTFKYLAVATATLGMGLATADSVANNEVHAEITALPQKSLASAIMDEFKDSFDKELFQFDSDKEHIFDELFKKCTLNRVDQALQELSKLKQYSKYSYKITSLIQDFQLLYFLNWEVSLQQYVTVEKLDNGQTVIKPTQETKDDKDDQDTVKKIKVMVAQLLNDDDKNDEWAIKNAEIVVNGLIEGKSFVYNGNYQDISEFKQQGAPEAQPAPAPVAKDSALTNYIVGLAKKVHSFNDAPGAVAKLFESDWKGKVNEMSTALTDLSNAQTNSKFTDSDRRAVRDMNGVFTETVAQEFLKINVKKEKIGDKTFSTVTFTPNKNNPITQDNDQVIKSVVAAELMRLNGNSPELEKWANDSAKLAVQSLINGQSVIYSGKHGYMHYVVRRKFMIVSPTGKKQLKMLDVIPNADGSLNEDSVKSAVAQSLGIRVAEINDYNFDFTLYSDSRLMNRVTVTKIKRQQQGLFKVRSDDNSLYGQGKIKNDGNLILQYFADAINSPTIDDIKKALAEKLGIDLKVYYISYDNTPNKQYTGEIRIKRIVPQAQIPTQTTAKAPASQVGTKKTEGREQNVIVDISALQLGKKTLYLPVLVAPNGSVDKNSLQKALDNELGQKINLDNCDIKLSQDKYNIRVTLTKKAPPAQAMPAQAPMQTTIVRKKFRITAPKKLGKDPQLKVLNVATNGDYENNMKLALAEKLGIKATEINDYDFQFEADTNETTPVTVIKKDAIAEFKIIHVDANDNGAIHLSFMFNGYMQHCWNFYFDGTIDLKSFNFTPDRIDNKMFLSELIKNTLGDGAYDSSAYICSNLSEYRFYCDGQEFTATTLPKFERGKKIKVVHWG